MVKAVEQRFDVQPLPPFADVSDAIREALPFLAPTDRVSVSEANNGSRYVEVNGNWQPWRPDVAPYMVEPMDTTASRRFDSVALCGPARTGKSDALILGTMYHAIRHAPGTIAAFNASRDVAKEWSESQLSAAIEGTPDWRDILDRRQGGDNLFKKRFRGNARVTIDWAVKTKLMQRTIKLGLATDYDAIPEDIEGDGELFPLLRKRGETYGSRAMTVVESSPRFEILDETWTPETPHEAPPTGGILAIYNKGSRGRWYWTCPDCTGEFEPRFDMLVYPDQGTPAERGAGAYLPCPHCGSVIEHKQKTDLNRTGRWLHEEADGTAVPLADLQRPVATASYWLTSLAAAFVSWAKLVSRLLEAEADFAKTKAEEGLKTVTNVELGLPYLPRAGLDGVSLSEAGLRGMASDHRWRVAPKGTRFLTAAVDVQKGRFVVQVEAWLVDQERVLIDRLDLFTPPPGAPGGDRVLDPSKYAEDWLALDALLDRVYPVEGEAFGLVPVAMVVDSAGEPGVTPKAYDYWRKRRLSHPNRVLLQKGADGEKVKRFRVARPETAHKGRDHVARDVILIWTGSDRLKDEVAASLLREEAGPGKLHVSRYAPKEVFAEYAAERKTDKGWKKRPGVKRNEALDLSVYSLALALALGVEDVDPAKPPRWCVPGPDNMMARPLEGAEAKETPEKPPAKVRKKKRVNRAKPIRW